MYIYMYTYMGVGGWLWVYVVILCSLVLVRQQVYDKENSIFKPVKIRLKTDSCHILLV